MAKTGRPCLPNAMRELKNGHYRKRNSAEPKPSGAVRCPSSLGPEARAVWRRLSKVLSPLGLLSSADVDAFAVLAVNIERWHRAQQEIAKFGEVVAVKTAAGISKPMVNPWMAIASAAEATIGRIGGEFGLSPAARTRLFSSVLAPPAAPSPHPDIAERYFEPDSGDDAFGEPVDDRKNVQ